MTTWATFPSLRLLYLLDEINEPSMTLKTIGHQWYWKYEHSDFLNIEFDSYMIPTNEMNNNNFRLLDVDNRVILHMNSQIRILVSAAGRLNQTNFMINRPGLFFGQCSEICGTNHSFMPIVIESIPVKIFIKWICWNNNLEF